MTSNMKTKFPKNLLQNEIPERGEKPNNIVTVTQDVNFD